MLIIQAHTNIENINNDGTNISVTIKSFISNLTPLTASHNGVNRIAGSFVTAS